MPPALGVRSPDHWSTREIAERIAFDRTLIVKIKCTNRMKPTLDIWILRGGVALSHFFVHFFPSRDSQPQESEENPAATLGGQSRHEPSSAPGPGPPASACVVLSAMRSSRTRWQNYKYHGVPNFVLFRICSDSQAQFSMDRWCSIHAIKSMKFLLCIEHCRLQVFPRPPTPISKVKTEQ